MMSGGAVRRGPRIYNLFPLLVGPVDAWVQEIPRVTEMDFDWIFVNPFSYPGFSGSLYAVKDYYRLNPLFRGSSAGDDDSLIADFTARAKAHGLSAMVDLVINHTAKDSVLVERHPDWFARQENGELRSPRAIDPDDPAVVTEWGDLAEIDYGNPETRAASIAYWRDLVRHYLDLGFRGFRGDAAYKVPAEVWREVIAGARETRPDAVFMAETLGCRPDEVTALQEAGFDYIFNSAKWWDFEAPWLLKQYETFRHLAPSIAFPESHDTERLIADLERVGISGTGAIEAAYRQRYLFAAAFSTGVMMPIGYEFGFRNKLDTVRTRPSDREERRFDLCDFIAETNRMKAAVPALNEEGPQFRLGSGDPQTLALCREASDGSRALTLVNRSAGSDRTVPAELLMGEGVRPGSVDVTPTGPHGTRIDSGVVLRLKPLEVRVFTDAGTTKAKARRKRPAAKARIEPPRSKPVIIQNISPSLDCGLYPVKREVGDALDVWADIFTEGHGKLAAVLSYRRQGETARHEVPMRLAEWGLDRWNASFPLEENTRYLYRIEAWPDVYESWRDGVEKKQAAGQAIGLELREGRALVEQALERAVEHDGQLFRDVLDTYDQAANDEARAAALTSARLRRLMRRMPDRRHVVLSDELEVVVDRPIARFGAWYEMFPRSQGSDPTRSATFEDCIRRLDALQAMGFDVVYLVPIHPIGRTHRKGRNNSLEAGPDDPGSPYAIGAAEGGHDAVHPELGTLEDFRRFVAAAAERGMEVALDFAIQCSPDHPWLKEHPDWFEYRPDGTIKYAENPPKKYQDIVNVNFAGPHAPDLWRALRDVILFWVEQGVRIFRVDNPHTKPVPFWEWLIRDIQQVDPGVIFLSEAFTRPKMLKMLAKIGFSQSYTYFTWRNTKHELTEYLTELSREECVEYLRPNFFTNTPDILPYFLQTSGRPGFQIRLVLAATLSPTYGIYNGFELCEATPVPGKEEYLHSEKYEYKVWDWDRPGNIKDYIAAVNRIRRENPALHHLRSLRFHYASDDSVLFYGKATTALDNAVLVAVNLDPFAAHEAEIDLPLDELGLAHEGFEIEDLLTGARHVWHGGRHRIRLDPHHNPALILRPVLPQEGRA